jgi:uncharacterized heparinase superfamily protein
VGSGGALRQLGQLGPHPLLVARMIRHRIASIALRRRLRDSYQEMIAAPVSAQLVIPPLDLPTARELPAVLLPAADRIRHEAELVTKHVVDFLGSGKTSLGAEIDWHADFKSGYRWPATFYLDLEITRLGDSSDAKVPWELSRGHQLLTLARAARLFEEVRFAVEFESQLGAWLDANPPGYGINWANAMEVAVRSVNWVWAVRTLEAWRPVSDSLRRRLSASLQAHARHITLNLEGSPYLRSNHFLADMLGLLVLGWALPGDPQARTWRALARDALEREIRLQVLPDGVGFEASTSYHGLSLEMMLIAQHVGILGGRPFSATYNARLNQMLEVSRAIRLATGRTPLFGDDDSGRVLPAGFDRPPSQDEILWLGAALLGGGRPLEGSPGEEVAWNLGAPRWRDVDRAEVASVPPSAFPSGGLYVLRGGGAQVVVRCGGVGQNGNGGHSHNDQLSYELATSAPLIVDSGTYSYTFDPAARNRFRGTAAHNGVMVDETEINPINPEDLFRLPARAGIRVERWQDDDKLARLVASHDGYRHLDGRPIHQRTLIFEKSTGRLNVIDTIEGRGTHDVVARIHLAAGTTVHSGDRRGTLFAKDNAYFRISWWGVNDVHIAEDFVSDRYGVKNAAPLITARLRAGLPLRFGHRIEPLLAGRATQPQTSGQVV